MQNRYRILYLPIRLSVFIEEKNQIICGDFNEINDKIPDKYFDLIIVDPPYNLTKQYSTTTFKDYVTPEEKEALTKLMDALLEWLYSDDEQLYNKNTLDLKSKDMMELGKVLYTRFDNWTKLEENIQLFEKGIEKINVAVKAESDKLANKQQTYLTPEDFESIDKLIKEAVAKVQDAKTKYGFRRRARASSST